MKHGKSTLENKKQNYYHINVYINKNVTMNTSANTTDGNSQEKTLQIIYLGMNPQ